MYFSTAAIAAVAGFLSLASAAPAAEPAADLEKRTLPSTSGNQELINRLTLAATGPDRIALLTNDDDFSFDFGSPPNPNAGNATGLGGHTVTANRKTMPGLIGHGSSMTVGFLGPCGMNIPHTHPRGTELNIVVEGALVTTMILENGVRSVSQNHTRKYQMTVFPQGALHQEFNPNCEPTVFVASFNNEDAGVQQTLQVFNELPPNVIRATAGGDYFIQGQDVEHVKGIVPKNVAKGVEACLTKCGIPKTK